ICERYDETFDHVWIFDSHAIEMNNIIQKTKEFFEGACNSLLINADKDPIIDNKLINKMTFWDWAYTYTSLIFENQNVQEKFLVLLRNFIFEKSWGFWIDRCLKQKEKEKRLKIILKKVKENYKEEYIDPNRKVNIFNLFNSLESL
ncbi:12089_t:CDS:2, partial [Rhizophagus irregularis]